MVQDSPQEEGELRLNVLASVGVLNTIDYSSPRAAWIFAEDSEK